MVERAAELGIAALAIADHDTVSGVEEAREAAAAHGIEFLPATEVSSSFNNMEVHVVGLGVDPQAEVLQDALERQRQGRLHRADRIIEKLHVLGVPVCPERIAARTANGCIGRMHIAQEIHELGFATTVQDAFDKYIGKGQKAFVRKPAMSCESAIRLIREAGGVAILAHPGIGTVYRALDRVLRLPFDGIEAYHCKHSPGQVEQFTQLARERGYLISGGSDCHGQAKRKPEMGNVRVPYDYFARLRDALAARCGGRSETRPVSEGRP